MKKKPKEAFDRWRKYVHAVNNNEILDGIRTQKVLVCLNRFKVKTMSDATQRIFGDGNKAKVQSRRFIVPWRKCLKLL